MNDSNKIKKLEAEMKELINKYKTYYMSDKERNELRNEIENIKNTINCMINMR
ncbi:hypothetical protein M0R72_16745 [Candidatus Pacearchaeota archaeon]|jgi:hypothetical protein|nr:hypothetical protein [Candidatus Pacearchaeota archaeon]